MSLSARLRHVDLTLECKYCGHLIIKQGDWFTVIHRFKCEGCNRETPMTYSDKIALFNKHAHLIASQAEVEPRPTARRSLCWPCNGRSGPLQVLNKALGDDRRLNARSSTLRPPSHLARSPTVERKPREAHA
jgi:hypothetical protein